MTRGSRCAIGVGGVGALALMALAAGAATAAPAPSAAPGPAVPAAPGAAAPAAALAPMPIRSYDEQAEAATAIGVGGLEGLTWAATARCDAGDELVRRQCRGVRDARLAQARSGVLRAVADRAAVEIGSWDPTIQGLSVVVRGCIACSFTVDMGDAGAAHVAAVDSASGAEGGAVRGAVLHRSSRLFSSETAASRWRDEVGPRLRTELLFRLPPVDARRPSAFAGVAIEIVGFRVHDPCSGAVVASSAPTDPITPSPALCGKAPPETPSADRPRIADQLAPADIRSALAPAEAAARKCFDRYGVAGEARFRIVIADSGAIITVSQDGDFVDTPTGACIEVAVRSARFPRTRRARASIVYPIVVR